MAAGLDDAIRHIRKLALSGFAGISDAQLLNLFVANNDQAAFEVLVKRHGSMVLNVCRRTLKNTQDVEDAFQATFLVLVRKAASIAKRELLANWLYGVAYRAALKMKQARVTRHFKERQVDKMVKRREAESDIPDEIYGQLDQELNRLPEKYRAAIVCCDLEGMTRSEAARKLRWPLGTLNWRLAKARSMVADRLKRRGLVVSCATLAAALQATASAGVPTNLTAAIIKSVVFLAGGQIMKIGSVSGTVISLTEGVVKAMFLSKLKVPVAVLALVGSLGIGARHSTFTAIAWETGPSQQVGVAKSPDKTPEAHPAVRIFQGDPDRPTQMEFGDIIIRGAKIILHEKSNIVEVDGVGSMSIPSDASFGDGKTKRKTRLTIHWNKDMFFNGKYADFHGGVEAYQDSAILKCQDLKVELDRVVSFKEGQKDNQSANVEKLLCDRNVWVVDEKKDPRGQLLQFDRLVATQLTVDNKAGPIFAVGPGKAEHLAPGGADDSPATAPRPKNQDLKDAQVLKLTRILYQDRMFSNRQDNSRNAKFYGNIEVFHFATDDPDAKMSPDNPPKDGFYMRCNILNVYTRQVGTKSSQMMRADGNVFFRTQEFFGTASVVKFDESTDQVIFEGAEGNPAALAKKRLGNPNPQLIKGAKILYNRKTGEFQVNGIKVVAAE